MYRTRFALQVPRHFVAVVFALAAGAALPGALNAQQQFAHIEPLFFTKPFGGANPLPQILSVTSTGAAFNFTVTASTNGGGNWLSVSPSGFCCTTPAPVSVIVNSIVTLAAGTYTGQVVLTASGVTTQTVIVTLIVAAPGTAFLDNMPGKLSFSTKTGGTSFTSQLLQVRNGGPGSLNWTLAASTFNGGNWLSVSSAGGAAPAFVTVSIVAQNLPNAGQLAGVFIGQLLFQGGGTSVTVPVSVTIGDNVFKQINPLSFTRTFGGADPLPQTLAVASTGAAFNFSSVAVSATGGNWLSVSPSGFCCTTPSVLTVSVNSAVTLAAGTYTAHVEFYTASTALVVPVTLTVAPAGGAFLDNMTGQLSYTLQTGMGVPPAQLVQVRNGGPGALNWTVTASTFDNRNWLTVTPSNGTAPSLVTVQISVANLPDAGLIAGVFTGQLLFQSSGSSVTVPVSVTVADTVFAQVNGLSFAKVFGGADPLPQTLVISSTGAAFNFSSRADTATGGDWLTVSPSGFCCTAPHPITVTVKPAVTLAAGTYTGEVVLYTASSAITVSVTLTIVPATATYFDNMPGQLSFALQTAAGAPPSQMLQVRNGGPGTLNWTAGTSTADGGSWLTISAASGTAPSTVNIGIVPANLPNGGLIAGTFSGQVLFQESGGGSISVPVTVTVGGNVFAQINGLSFTKPFGAGNNPLPQIVTPTSLGAAFNFTATVTTANGGDWLQIAPSGFCCTTPRIIKVTVNAAAALAVGTYTGQVVFSTATNAITVPVMLTVAPQGGTFLDNLQGQMSFSSLVGGAGLTSQTIQIRNGGPGALNWTLTRVTFDNGNWLTVSAASGVTPATVTIGVTPANLPGLSLIAGVYTGELLFQSGASSVTVPISVELGPNVFGQSGPLSFVKAFGGSNPATQPINVSSSGTAFNFTAVASSGTGGNWLSISPSGFCCTTPRSVTATVNTTTLAAGTYTGQVVFDKTSTSMTVPVTLTIMGPAPVCTFMLNRTASSAGAQGDTQSVTVTASDSSCIWNSQTASAFITLLSPASQTGTGRLRFTVAANAGAAARTATIAVAGQTFTVNQAGAGCVIAPVSQSSASTGVGGSFTVNVNTAAGCAWTPSAAPSWITLTSGAGGVTGPGSFSFNVAVNPNSYSRTGSISLGGQIVQLLQNATTPTQVFDDVPLNHPYFDYIGLMSVNQITSGCSPTSYCPDSNTTRSQMAVFIIRGLMGDTFDFPAAPFFTDVPANHPHFKWVQKMKELGITSGCSDTLYCPDNPVTRGQMAVFVIRARLGLAAGDAFLFTQAPYFTDVPTTDPYFGFIQKMKELGVTLGCSATMYCGDSPTTRGQMAVFLIRGLLTP